MRKGLHDFFGYGLGLREKVEVIRAARLGICARHVESAEGMSAHHGPGALAVDVEIADVKVAGGTVDFVARFGIDGAGQAELSVVGDFESVIEPAGFDDGQHWAENFFLLELRFRGDVGEDGGLDVIPFSSFWDATAASEQAAVFLTLLDIAEDGLQRAFVDYRTHAAVLGGISHFDFFYAGFELFKELVVNPLVDDSA
jgi:hypothetical protein